MARDQSVRDLALGKQRAILLETVADQGAEGFSDGWVGCGGADACGCAQEGAVEGETCLAVETRFVRGEETGHQLIVCSGAVFCKYSGQKCARGVTKGIWRSQPCLKKSSGGKLADARLGL